MQTEKCATAENKTLSDGIVESREQKLRNSCQGIVSIICTDFDSNYSNLLLRKLERLNE